MYVCTEFQNLWRLLCDFHMSAWQIADVLTRCLEQRKRRTSLRTFRWEEEAKGTTFPRDGSSFLECALCKTASPKWHLRRDTATWQNKTFCKSQLQRTTTAWAENSNDYIWKQHQNRFHSWNVARMFAADAADAAFNSVLRVCPLKCTSWRTRTQKKRKKILQRRQIGPERTHTHSWLLPGRRHLYSTQAKIPSPLKHVCGKQNELLAQAQAQARGAVMSCGHVAARIVQVESGGGGGGSLRRQAISGY